MKSMTGFGAASAPVMGQMLRVEMSGINRKQLEVSINMPRAWAELEPAIRALVAERVSRGRVQVSISFEQSDSGSKKLSTNEAKLSELCAQLPLIQEKLGSTVSVALSDLLRLGIIEEDQEQEVTAEERWAELAPLVSSALENYMTMKQEEGNKLQDDMLSRIALLRDLRLQLGESAAGVTQHYRANLLRRLLESDLALPLDDERIVKEVAIFADRCDISEELTRLDCHLDQFCALCEKDEPLGRTLDFLCQEIFRELNTTGSKANNAALAQLVVSAKTELEKIREQVQNIE